MGSTGQDIPVRSEEVKSTPVQRSEYTGSSRRRRDLDPSGFRSARCFGSPGTRRCLRRHRSFPWLPQFHSTVPGWLSRCSSMRTVRCCPQVPFRQGLRKSYTLLGTQGLSSIVHLTHKQPRKPPHSSGFLDTGNIQPL